MKEQQIIEKNKLIAEFMGGHIIDHFGTDKIIFYEMSGGVIADNPINFHSLKYHSSWDWLMPVVEKIEKTNRYGNEYYPDMVAIWKDVCKISDGNNGSELFYVVSHKKSKIEAVWLAVIKFIEWYNKNNK